MNTPSSYYKEMERTYLNTSANSQGFVAVIAQQFHSKLAILSNQLKIKKIRRLKNCEGKADLEMQAAHINKPFSLGFIFGGVRLSPWKTPRTCKLLLTAKRR